MKKQMVILFVGIALVLGACGNNEEDNAPNNEANHTNNTEENQDQANDDQNILENENGSENESTEDAGDDTGNNSEDAEDSNSEDQSTDDSENQESALADFLEYETLVEQIDVDELEADIKTDNPNKRVIIYADTNGHKQYKSIFIKNKNRLKIIEFDKDGEIFNEVIE